jgi:hypothetical protein
VDKVHPCGPTSLLGPTSPLGHFAPAAEIKNGQTGTWREEIFFHFSPEENPDPFSGNQLLDGGFA